jgi:hypothetical protein
LEVPGLTAVARPAAVIVAVEAFDDVHDTLLVTLRVLASVYVPVAVNCRVSPLESVVPPGVTEIDCSAMTLKVKFCTAFGPTPLVAVKVIG